MRNISIEPHAKEHDHPVVLFCYLYTYTLHLLTTSPGLLAEPASDHAFSNASQSRIGSIFVQTSYLFLSLSVFISY